MLTRVSVVVILFIGLVLVESHLSSDGKECGEKRCKEKEYCESSTRQCLPCVEICELGHNYQESVCTAQCQDYIHEKRFAMKGLVDEELQSTITRLTVLATIAMVISILSLIIATAAISLLFWYRKKEKKLTSKHIKAFVKENGKVNYKNETLKLDVNAAPLAPSTITTALPPVTPATTSTPLSVRPRYPKEDPTLEYGAYDNPALAPSPVFDSKQETPPAVNTTPISRRQESSF